MSKSKKTITKEKEKDNYLKFSFLFPVIVTLIDAVIMSAVIYVTLNQATLGNVELGRLIFQTGSVLLALSPTFLMITAFVSLRHAKKHPNGSPFYIKTPMFLSVTVWGAQVMYMVTLMGA
ncbi:MAG: hypothetical protein IKU54_05245 [Oscillospiraceae bacterium]|nr:hypothetical protein [Oscillospiraceae bacterium]